MLMDCFMIMFINNNLMINMSMFDIIIISGHFGVLFDDGIYYLKIS